MPARRTRRQCRDRGGVPDRCGGGAGPALWARSRAESRHAGGVSEVTKRGLERLVDPIIPAQARIQGFIATWPEFSGDSRPRGDATTARRSLHRSWNGQAISHRAIRIERSDRAIRIELFKSGSSHRRSHRTVRRRAASLPSPRPAAGMPPKPPRRIASRPRRKPAPARVAPNPSHSTASIGNARLRRFEPMEQFSHGRWW